MCAGVATGTQTANTHYYTVVITFTHYSFQHFIVFIEKSKEKGGIHSAPLQSNISSSSLARFM